METDITFDNVTVAACDQVIAGLSAQRIPISQMGLLCREVDYWLAIRHAKARQEIEHEQGRA